MAIAAQKNGYAGLGQAAALLYGLPAGAITDIVPVSLPNNLTGTITVNGTLTSVTADELAAPLGNTTSYFSALYNSPGDSNWYALTFGTDTSLTVTPGWDNMIGLGPPNDASFVSAIAP